MNGFPRNGYQNSIVRAAYWLTLAGLSDTIATVLIRRHARAGSGKGQV